MNSFIPSEKLTKYLSKVEKQTGRKIVIQKTRDVGLSGMTAAFAPHPQYIAVEVVSTVNMADLETERSIAHEVTHGLLIYSKGYYHPAMIRTIDRLKQNHVNLVFTMIDDIVVNKIIHEEGFPPFGGNYLPMVKKETEDARNWKDTYRQYSYDPVFKSRFMVFRYIMAWSFLEYFDLDPRDRIIISRFAKWFEKSYQRQYQAASEIKEFILQNDIFTPEGHRRTIESILKLWRLDDLVRLETI